jgi:hypothetical protein
MKKFQVFLAFSASIIFSGLAFADIADDTGSAYRFGLPTDWKYAVANATPNNPDAVTYAKPAANSLTELNLSLSYNERVLVPGGSALDVQVFDHGGKRIYATHSATPQQFPPYLVRVPIKSEDAFPVKVAAALTSVIGHRFSETVEIAQPKNRTPGRYEIVMKMR